MRKYIRHPAEMPIEVNLPDAGEMHSEKLRNVSRGGLCFHSDKQMEPGATVKVRVSLVRPPFEAPARIMWCRQEDGAYVMGAAFIQQNDLFRARMVEQVCYIEHYRNEMRRSEGRDLTSEEAALEWIDRYAADFPGFES